MAEGDPGRWAEIAALTARVFALVTIALCLMYLTGLLANLPNVVTRLLGLGASMS
jgi:hypothetical protein